MEIADLHMPNAAGGETVHRPRSYTIARSSWMTLFAIALELGELLLLILIGDVEIAALNQKPPFVDHDLTTIQLLMALAALGYALVGVEFIVRNRRVERTSTIPIVLLPLGRLIRSIGMTTLCILVLTPRLVSYFLFALIGIPLSAPEVPPPHTSLSGSSLGFKLMFPILAPLWVVYVVVSFPIVALSRVLSKVTGRSFIDAIDSIFEPFDHFVNRLFNRVHFHKIDEGGTVFNSLFNLSLSTWCLNH